MGKVTMRMSDSTLRFEDDELNRKPKVQKMPQAMPPASSTPPFAQKAQANFIENVNNGLAIGGSNGNLNTQIPQSMDTQGGRQLTQADLEKILKEI